MQESINKLRNKRQPMEDRCVLYSNDGRQLNEEETKKETENFGEEYIKDILTTRISSGIMRSSETTYMQSERGRLGTSLTTNGATNEAINIVYMNIHLYCGNTWTCAV